LGIDGVAGDLDAVDGPQPSDRHFQDVGLHVSLEVDTLDASIFPTFGVRAGVAWLRRYEALGSDEDYEILTANGYGAYTVGGQTFGLLAGAQVETSGQTQIANMVGIGGLFRVSGLGPVKVVGPEGALASLITYRNVSGPLYLGGSIEAGGIWDGWDEIDSEAVMVGASVFAGMRTPVGPIYLAYGWAEAGERAAYLIFGQIF
jgi:NTE family protein